MPTVNVIGKFDWLRRALTLRFVDISRLPASDVIISPPAASLELHFTISSNSTLNCCSSAFLTVKDIYKTTVNNRLSRKPLTLKRDSSFKLRTSIQIDM